MGNARNHWKSSKTSVATCKRERTWVSQHPPVHHPKNPVLGFHGWDETVPQGSVYLVSIFFFFCSFFSLAQFFYHFSFGPPLTPSFFWEALTYSNHLPPFFLPTHLLPSSCWPPPHSPPFALTSIARASDLERTWSSSKLQDHQVHNSLKSQEFQECCSSLGASMWWQ